MNITHQEAKQIMDSRTGYVILDTRTQEEFAVNRIPGAILIPYNEVRERAPVELPRKDQLILVYCRSGRRSKLAQKDMVAPGYTNVIEFGGILDWPYEVEEDG